MAHHHIFLYICLAGTIGGGVYYFLGLWSAIHYLRRKPVQMGSATQPVCVLKPLRGADPEAYTNFRSHCLQEYPEFDLIFGVQDAADPAAEAVRRLVAEFPERAVRLVLCPEVLGTNRKVSTLIGMLPEARYGHLLINDSDIGVPPDYLRRVMAEFHDPQVGMVTSLYRGIAGRTLGSKLEALGISGEFMPGVLTARFMEGGIHFALGSTLALDRKALAAIGGLEPLLDYLADDFELGARVSRAGFKVALADVVVESHLPDYSLSGFFEHQLRWGRSTRHSRPLGYAGLVFTFGLVWAMLTVLAARGVLWSWIPLAGIAALRIALALLVGEKILGDAQVLRDLWLLPLRDIVSVAVWIGSYTGRTVAWRGDTFILKDGKLHPA